MNNSIAFFDFDGTITCKDTMFEFIKFQKGERSYYLGMIKLSPWLIAMKLRLVSKTAAKEMLLTHFFGGIPLTEFQNHCDAFIKHRLPRFIRPAALQEILRHKQNQATVVVVSASAENWIAAWCNQYDIQCIATQLETSNGQMTGKIVGENCNGEEKVRRIKSQFRLDDYKSVWAYGDTKGDKPMLSLAAFAMYKPFRTKPAEQNNRF